MRRICVLAALFLLAISAYSHAQTSPQSGPTLPPDYITIDGAKTPEQIPEYLTWTTGFNTIGYLTEKNVTEGPMVFLRQLSPGDRDVLFAEVYRHKERAEKCQERGERLVEAIKDDIKKLEQEMKANTLECRIKLLEAKDLMLTHMSPEGAAVLTNWMLDERRKIKSFLPKSDLDFYRLPR